MNNALLSITLGAAVPLLIEDLKKVSLDALMEEAPVLAQIIAEKGDVIQFRVKGETSKAFNALARGLAIAAFVPGGVTFDGMHFEAKHPETPEIGS